MQRATWLFLASLLSPVAAADLDRATVAQALQRAVVRWHGAASTQGGYVYYYTPDFRQRWGESLAGPTTIYVQPPGTPTVGEAFLAAWQATGDAACLTAAQEAAGALLDGQLVSGGWTQVIEFGPAARLGRYRRRPGGSWDVSSFDDDQTTAALRFLLRLDAALAGRDAELHAAVTVALDAVLAAQFAAGGFPQVFRGPVAGDPPRPASYPPGDWRTANRVKNYWDLPTLNDGLAGHLAETLLLAWHLRGDPRCVAALRRLGDFLLLARLPAPQPAWCQQYSPAMQPAWGRRFEPPAVASLESQDVLATLIRLSRELDEPRLRAAVPLSLAYLRRLQLPDGQLSRFYELHTDRPLYVDQEYRLSYDETSAPAHYGWRQPAGLDELAAAWQQAETGVAPVEPTVSTTAVAAVVAALTPEATWPSVYHGERLVGQPGLRAGQVYLSSAVFAAHAQLLADWLRQAGP
ncbi:MAG: hypothetical protein IT204_16640 [Fimbriimonadaceae bacterium]|nr:hypothetical protein [Fimbriimonadaceae bacterium]